MSICNNYMYVVKNENLLNNHLKLICDALEPVLIELNFPENDGNFPLAKNKNKERNLYTKNILNLLEKVLKIEDLDINDYEIFYSFTKEEKDFHRNRGYCDTIQRECFINKNTGEEEEEPFPSDLFLYMLNEDIPDCFIISTDEYTGSYEELCEIHGESELNTNIEKCVKIENIYLTIPVKNELLLNNKSSGFYYLDNKEICPHRFKEISVKTTATEEEIEEIEETSDLNHDNNEKYSDDHHRKYYYSELVMVKKEKLNGYMIGDITINKILNDTIINKKIKESNEYIFYKENYNIKDLKEEDIENTSFEKLEVPIISCSSNNEIVSDIFKKHNYTYEKMKNEIFLPSWKKAKTALLFGNDRTKSLLIEIKEYMEDNNLLTINLCK